MSCGVDDVDNMEFMSRLAGSDFVIRPTHIVTDDEGIFHGTLSDYHPASSLLHTIQSLHPATGTEQCVLYPRNVDPSPAAIALTARAESISWPVKLAWVTDIAASLAWLHSQDTVWGDLKVENIVLCTDGHCRLIDVSPGGWTELWCPPEADLPDFTWRPTAQGDVFALGLVLWDVAMEVGTFRQEPEFAAPPAMPWGLETPVWFQRLVAECVEYDPSRRPTARAVYDTLVREGASLFS